MLYFSNLSIIIILFLVTEEIQQMYRIVSLKPINAIIDHIGAHLKKCLSLSNDF